MNTPVITMNWKREKESSSCEGRSCCRKILMKWWEFYILQKFSGIDLRAATCWSGSTMRIIEFTDRTCDILAYHELYNEGCIHCHSTAAFATQDEKTHTIVINKCVFVGEEQNTNQMRANGVLVNKEPMILASRWAHSHHFSKGENSGSIGTKLLVTRIPWRRKFRITVGCIWYHLWSEIWC